MKAQTRIRLWGGAAMLAAWSVCRAAQFDVPAGDAARMLNAWSYQAGVQVLFEFHVARFYVTGSVHGDMSPQAAIARMLRGTNLTFTWVNARTVGVTEAVRICRPYSGLPVRQLPLPPCVQGPAAGEKRLTRL